MLNIPVEFQSFLNRPGREWQPDELDRFMEWLLDDQQSRRLVNFARHWLGTTCTSDELQDAVTEFLIKFAKWIPKMTADHMPKNWETIILRMFTQVLHGVHKRRISRGDDKKSYLDNSDAYYAPTNDPAGSVAMDEMHLCQLWELITKCLKGNETKITLVQLICLEGMTQREAADLLGREVKSIEYYKRLAIEQLKRCPDMRDYVATFWGSYGK